MKSGCSTCSGSLDATKCGWTPSAPPSPPEDPPLPPSPPSKCLPKKGDELPKTTEDHADPVNEPCYSHSSCAGYTKGAEPYASGTGSGYICCVKVGSCDNLVSNSKEYYEGGCIGINYAASTASSTSTSTGNFKTSVEGCYKQGECNLPHIQQNKGWTTGESLEAAVVPDSTMSVLLTSANEPAGDGGCRGIYKFAVQEKNEAVSMKCTLDADISSVTDDVLSEMKDSVALTLSVSSSNVDISVSSGSVELTITVSYADESGATAGLTAMQNMESADVATMLTTDSFTATVNDVSTPVQSTYFEPGQSPSPPNPPSSPPSSDDNTAVLIGAGVGGAVGAIIIIALAWVVIKKRSAKTQVKPVA
jgi:hypothetical protein